MEDDPIQLELLCFILQEGGLDVLVARNGQEAIQIVENDARIALVVMDAVMPIMDGITATRTLKERAPQIPVVGVTASPSARKAFLNVAANAVIFKPFKAKELLETIQNSFENQGL